jgi:hypothetical protein
LGLNTITSFSLGEKNKSLQGGLLAEYYFAKHWSIMGRIKYFRTGVSYSNFDNNSNTSSNGNGSPFFSLFSSSYRYAYYEGAVISIPINVKWEYNIIKNLKGNIKHGYSYNYEAYNKYYYSSEITPNNRKSSLTHNLGIGISCNISNKATIFMEWETYQLGGEKFTVPALIIPGFYFTTNDMLNFGVKYNFKK